MPQIPEYQSQSGLRPSDRGALANVYAGRSIAANYDQIGRSIGGTVERLGSQYVQHQERQEISRGAAQIAELNDTLSEGWKAAAAEADLNDGSLPDKYRTETLEPALQGYLEGFTTEGGKKWAENQVASMRQHWFEKTAADQATRSGQALAVNLDVLKTRATNTVANDPTALNATLGLIDNTVNGLLDSSPTLTPAQNAAARAELSRDLKSDVTKAALVGMASTNPAAVKEEIAKGNYAEYLTSDELAQVTHFADQVLNAQKADARAAEVEERRVAKENFDKVAATLSASLFAKDGKMQSPPGFNEALVAAAAMPYADSGTIRALGAAHKQAVEDQARSVKVEDDPATYSAFVSRMRIPKGMPNALTDQDIHMARATGHLSNDSWSFFLRANQEDTSNPAKQSLTKDANLFFDGVKSLITKSNPFMSSIDNTGDVKFAEFQRDVLDLFNAEMAAGMSPEQVRQKYLRPDAPDYLLKIVPKYTTTSAQSERVLEDFMTGKTPAIPYTGIFAQQPAPAAPGAAPAAPQGTTPYPQRQAGESIDALRARIAQWERANPAAKGGVVLQNQAEIMRREQAAKDKAASDAAVQAQEKRLNPEGVPRGLRGRI